MTPTLSLRRVLPVLALYVIISALGLHAHELFLDEAHHFLLARDSATLTEMYNNARYDGHPRLWHALLFFITHVLTPDPVAMQVLQWLISAAVAFVFLRYAPFNLAVKAGVLFGYYFLFEYNILSRNYALGLLFLFLCCALLTGTRQSPAGTGRPPAPDTPGRPLLTIGILVFLMCNTHLFFTFASLGLYGYLFIEHAGQKKLLTPPFLLFTGLFLLGFACALVQARVPSVDNANLTPVHPDKWLSAGNFSFATFGLVRGWLPIPSTPTRFWNHYWLSKEKIGSAIGMVLFLFFLGFPTLLLRKKIKALLFYYTCALLLIVFFVVTQMTAARYFGMVFVFFLVAAWLSAEGAPDALAPATPFFRVCLYGILAIQLAVGWFAFEQDLTRPFSQSRNTVRYLQSLQPAGEKIVVDGYNSGPMLCAYLGGKVFYLTTGQEGSFCVWKKSYFPNPRPGIGLELAQWPSLQQLPQFILVSNRQLDNCENPHFQLTPLQSFGNSIQGENYYIYRVNSR